VEALRAHTERPQIHASFLELFAAAGAHAGGLPGWVLQRPGLVRLLLMKRLKGNPLTLAVMTNTLNPTGYGGAAEPNVVPSESWANLDARLLPGTNPDAFLAKLGSIIDDERIRIDVTSLVESNVSPWTGDPLYEALVTRAVEGKPEAVAGPVLSPGYTDSAPLRALGVRAYGFLPVMMGEPQIVTMHGDNERISVAQITDGLRVLALALADVVAQAGATRPPPDPIAWPTDWPFSTEGLVVPPLPPRGARLTDDPRWDEPVVLDVSPDESKARSIRDPSAAQELPQTPQAN
jgi:acetylornithine deacetylase/succinyl-diaminopimelate desuccinylase-like protein